MKILKKVVCIVVAFFVTLIIYSIPVKAVTTLKVTAETLNLRENATTSSDIIALLSQGDECELIEKDGDWYKVKYRTYTGYVSKDYVKEQSSTSQDNKEDNSNEAVDENEDNQNKNDENTEDKNNSAAGNNNTVSDDNDVIVTGKISKKTSLKLVPLIYSSEIDTLNKNEEIMVISELNGWAYVQTDTVIGWIRSDSIKDKQTISNNSSIDNASDSANSDSSETTDTNDNSTDSTVNNDDSDTNSERTDNANNTENADNNEASESYEKKTMYINDYFVNVRKEPNTSSQIVMTLELNTKLTVIGESGDWYKVSTSEGDAYISRKLLSSKQVTSSRGRVNKVVSNSSDNIADTTILSSTAKTETTSSATTTESKKEKVEASSSNNKTTTSNSAKGQEIIDYAKQFLGVPYVYGGASKSGFDCSGFTMYVYKKFGISMAHGAQAQSKLGQKINADKNSASSLKQKLKPGDLVFFLDYETMDEIGHCGIYIGDGKFIHASSGSGYCVKINSLLPGEYYNTRYCGARRLV